MFRSFRKWFQSKTPAPIRTPKNKLDFRARLGLDRLEDRSVPADLNITSVVLVDSSGADLVGDPVTGEQVFLKATYDTTGLSTSDSYILRFNVDGIPLVSPTQTGAAGNQTLTFTTGGWFAGPGSHPVSVTVDANSQIVETDENNTFNLNFTSSDPVFGNKFTAPLGGTPFQDWSIFNYVDVDPRTSFTDFRNQPFTKAGQTGIDYYLPNFKRMDSGRVPVFAVTSGTVTAVVDTNFDRETVSNPRPTNSITIDHGDGWVATYSGLAADTAAVQVGDIVTSHQPIALIGSPGDSTDPHLTFTLSHNGALVETSYAPTAYWQNPLPYQGDQTPSITAIGTSNASVALDFKEGPVSVTTFPTDANWDVYLWFRASYAQAGQTFKVSWFKPDNTLKTFDTLPVNAFKRFGDYVFVRPFTDYNTFPGLWRVEVELDNTLIAATTFTVAASPVSGVPQGDPTIRVSQGTTYIVPARTTPINFGTVSQNAGLPQKTFSVFNTGNVNVTLADLDIPQGYNLVGSLSPVVVLPGTSATFTLEMDTSVVGAKRDHVTFTYKKDSQVTPTVFSIPVSGNVIGTADPNHPALTVADTPAFIYLNNPTIFVVPGTTLADSNSTTFNTGVVTLENLGVDPNVLFTIRNQGTATGEIGVTGNTVTFGGSAIGTFAGGVGTTPLVISLTSGATLSAVEALLNNLQYKDTSANPLTNPRYLRVQVRDDLGNYSIPVVKTILHVPEERAKLTISGVNTQVKEGADTDTYTITLAFQPTADVTIDIIPASGDVTFSPVSPIVFTPLNWNIPQTITITAVDDAFLEGSEAVTFKHTLTTTDTRYNGIELDLPVLILDNEVGIAGVNIVESNGSTAVNEQGATSDTYTFVLTSPPQSDVTVTLTPSVAGRFTLSSTTLVFTALNWAAPQTVTITAVDDMLQQGPQVITIGHTLASADANYNNLAVPNVSVNVADNDVPGFTLTPSSGNRQVSEGGTTDSYTIVLTSQPTADVTVTLTGGTQLTTTPTTLVFTTANWNVPQTVTIQAVDDLSTEGNHTGTIIHGVTSGDGLYNGFVIPNVTANITDNDQPGIIILPTGTNDVTEEGGTDTFSIILNSVPTAPVTVTLTFANSQITVSPAVLTFTALNWNQPQVVTISGVNDGQLENLHTSVITTKATSADAFYNNLVGPNVTVNITDYVNKAPTQTVPATEIKTDMNQSVVVTGISIADVDAGANNVQVILTVSHGTFTVRTDVGGGLTVGQIVGNGTTSVKLTGTLAAINATLASGITYVPTPDYFGPDTLTVTTNDLGSLGTGGALSVTGTRPINVAFPNRPPQLSVKPISIAENSKVHTSVAFLSGFDPDANQRLRYEILSGNERGAFALNAVTGQLTVASTAPLDYETVPDHRFVLRVRLTDDGDPNLSTIANVPVLVTNVADTPNRAPTIRRPGMQTTFRSTRLVFSSANGNAITVADPDAGFQFMEVKLTVNSGVDAKKQPIPAGTLRLASTSNLGKVIGNGTGSITFRGNQDSINKALNGLVYTPIFGSLRSATFTVTVNDLGSIGTGGAKTATTALTIRIQNRPPVAPLPGYSLPGNAASASNLLMTVRATNGNISVPVTGLTNVSGNGFSVVTFRGAGNAVTNALRALVFTPDPGFTGRTSLTITTNNNGAIVSEVVRINVLSDVSLRPLSSIPTPFRLTMIQSQRSLTVTPGFGLIRGKTDADGDPIKVILVSKPTRGTLTLNADGSFVYTRPTTTYQGPDDFVIRYNDGLASSQNFTVEIDLLGPSYQGR